MVNLFHQPTNSSVIMEGELWRNGPGTCSPKCKDSPGLQKELTITALRIMTIMVIMNDHDIGKWRAMGNVVQSQKEGAGKEVKTGQPPLKVKACLLITDHIVTFFIIINSIAILTIILILIILQNHPQTSRHHYSDWGDSGQYTRKELTSNKYKKIWIHWQIQRQR